jgi:orotidine-5'-phosphate decarboxylase
MAMIEPVPIVALDVQNVGAAMRLVDELGDSCGYYKVGSELYTSAGPLILAALHEKKKRVFLDLKFHDIPNTVRGAVGAATESPCVKLLTVHASGGRAMISAAVDAAKHGAMVFCVTVLTSLDRAALGDSWGREIVDMQREVLRLAELASSAGARGVVCSGQEAGQVRDRWGGAVATLVPGIRLPGDAAGDQARIVTPRAAAEAGAGFIVLGRTVTAAASPRDAMERVLADLS